MNATEYNRINELLSEYSSISASFEQAEGEIKLVQLAAAHPLLPQHAELKIKLAAIEDKLRTLADSFYAELFPADKKRSHATPFGSLKYHKSSSLESDDWEKTLLKIKLACQKERERVGRLPSDGAPNGFENRLNEADLIRTREEPNLETLANLDDATLALFGIRREHKDNFKIVPFNMKTDNPAKKKTPKEEQEAA